MLWTGGGRGEGQVRREHGDTEPVVTEGLIRSTPCFMFLVISLARYNDLNRLCSIPTHTDSKVLLEASVNVMSTV